MLELLHRCIYLREKVVFQQFVINDGNGVLEPAHVYLGGGERCLRIFLKQQYRATGDFSVTDEFQFLQEFFYRFVVAGKGKILSWRLQKKDPEVMY
ncbi:MAG: hypothetical protein LUQ31_01520 [Methanoregula sp.]|nr:hypothetical protein [Methanoregula sp.]